MKRPFNFARALSIGIVGGAIGCGPAGVLHAQEIAPPAAFDLARAHGSVTLADDRRSVSIARALSIRSPPSIKTDDARQRTTVETAEATFTVTNATGRAALALTNHSLANALTAQTTWKRSAEVTLRPARLSDAGVELHAGAISQRRPFLFGRGQRHGLGEPDLWRETEGWQARLSFQPLDGMTYSGGFAGTRHRLSRATRFQDPHSTLLGAPEWERGNAWWHRAETVAPIGKQGSIRLFGMVGYRGEDFRDTALDSLNVPMFAGDTHEIGMQFKYGEREAYVQSWSTDGDLIGVGETTLKLRSNGITAKWVRSRWSFDLPFSSLTGGRYISEERSERSSIYVDVGELTGNNSLPWWIPDKISASASRKRLHDFDARSVERTQLRSSRMLSLTWEAEKSLTDISVTGWSHHGIQGTPTAALAQRGTAVSFHHTRWGKDWEAGIYAIYDGENRHDGRSRSWSAGISGSLDREGLPKISLALDYNSYDEDDPFLRFRNTALELSAKLDLSQLLEPDGAGGQPELHLRAFTDYETSRMEYLERQTLMGPTVILTYAKDF